MNDAVDIPIVVYNVPSRTIVDIGNETLGRLSKLPNVLGIKDATGEVARVSQQMKVCGPDWVMMSGDDPTGLGYIAHGGHGCISVTANVAPQACSAFYNALMGGDFATARQWQERLIALHKVLFVEPSPGPTKFALSHLGLCTDEVRLPITPCTDAVKPQILAAMTEAGLA